jgi:hypothetical protein
MDPQFDNPGGSVRILAFTVGWRYATLYVKYRVVVLPDWSDGMVGMCMRVVEMTEMPTRSGWETVDV